MNEITFQSILNEVKNGRNPRTAFDFRVYYDCVKHVPEHMADVLKERMIMCEKNFFGYPVFLKEIAQELMPRAKQMKEDNVHYYRNSNNELVRYNIDEHCWNDKCKKKLSPDEKDFCKECLERDKRDLEKTVARIKKHNPANFFLKLFEKYLS